MRALRLQEIKEAQAAKQPAQSLIPLVDFSNLKKHLEVKGEGHAVICMCRRLSYYYCYAHTPIHLYLAEVYTGGGGRGSHGSTHPRSISRGRRMALFSSSSLPSVAFVIHLLLRCILQLNGFLHHTPPLPTTTCVYYATVLTPGALLGGKPETSRAVEHAVAAASVSMG